MKNQCKKYTIFLFIISCITMPSYAEELEEDDSEQPMTPWERYKAPITPQQKMLKRNMKKEESLQKSLLSSQITKKQIDEALQTIKDQNEAMELELEEFLKSEDKRYFTKFNFEDSFPSQDIQKALETIKKASFKLDPKQKTKADKEMNEAFNKNETLRSQLRESQKSLLQKNIQALQNQK